MPGGKFRFLSTLSLRRATQRGRHHGLGGRISIHALLAESDVSSRSVPSSCRRFLSTLSLRRATAATTVAATRPVDISIHALLAESDGRVRAALPDRQHFYPRSPCGERRGAYRGARQSRRHFYPRSPCGERPPQGWPCPGRTGNFYPRSPCGERLSSRKLPSSCRLFLSTLSLRRATLTAPLSGIVPDISIHALLAESDVTGLIFRAKFVIFLSTLSLRRATRKRSCPVRLPGYFYPRSPCGERREIWESDDRKGRFLSTLSLRRATPPGSTPGRATKISIHALLAESDPRKHHRNLCSGISIHALLAESDLMLETFDTADRTFLSTLSLRRATRDIANGKREKNISIHALLAESDLPFVK